MSTTVSTATNPLAALASAASQSAGATSAGATSSASGQESNFLQLLVTQLENQDPLNPMDNSQITSQLAQISTVNGIDQLNTTLQGIASNYGTSQSLQATAMIGHNVLVPGNTLQLTSSGAQGGVDLPQAADSVVVSILDGSGQVVHKADLGPQSAGVIGFQWDGVTDSGATAAPGNYTFSVTAEQGGSSVDATALALGQVSGVTQGQNGVDLNVNGMGQVPLSNVKQVM